MELPVSFADYTQTKINRFPYKKLIVLDINSHKVGNYI